MICLDTNAAITILRGAPAYFMRRFEEELSAGSLALSVIVLHELQYGVEKSARQARNAERLGDFLRLPLAILPFEGADAYEAGEIRAYLEKKGSQIGPYDVLIAAQARRRDAILVTANTSEFTRVPRLRVENWL